MSVIISFIHPFTYLPMERNEKKRKGKKKGKESVLWKWELWEGVVGGNDGREEGVKMIRRGFVGGIWERWGEGKWWSLVILYFFVLILFLFLFLLLSPIYPLPPHTIFLLISTFPLL